MRVRRVRGESGITSWLPIVALGLALGVLAWIVTGIGFGGGGGGSKIAVDNIDMTPIGGQPPWTVTWQVHAAPGTPVTCTVRVEDASSKVLGHRVVKDRVPSDVEAGGNRQITTTVDAADPVGAGDAALTAAVTCT